MGCGDDAGESSCRYLSRCLLTVSLCLQSFITFMDALKLKMRAKDQLHPILQELVTGYARFKGSKDWEGRSKMVAWCIEPCVSPPAPAPCLTIRQRLITLNGMKASEELTEEQSRQVMFSLPFGELFGRCSCFLIRMCQLSFDIEHAYAEFFRSLSSKESS